MNARLAILPHRMYSPFLGRDVATSQQQWRLVTHITRRPGGWSQRKLAEAAGYADPGALNRSLHHLARLGILAVSTTRGRKGQTVAWLRAGVHAGGRAAATIQQLIKRTAEMLHPPKPVSTHTSTHTHIHTVGGGYNKSTRAWDIDLNSRANRALRGEA